MNRVCISFSSRNRFDLTKRTITPLLSLEGCDLWWYDASTDDDACQLFDLTPAFRKERLTGGSCRYIVKALTDMLAERDENGMHYDYVGLVENDVLLDDNWFEPTMDLFRRGKDDGLSVGAVSARTYEDRILIQRDGYAVMHNLGAGMIIFTRAMARQILKQYRTGITTENRKVFSMLSGIDIGRYWAFRGLEHMLVADWSYDRMMAELGYCSLALTPTKAIQLEDIAAMGLKAATEPVDALKDDKAFATFAERTRLLRKGDWSLPAPPGARLYHDNTWIIFPHQIPTIGGHYQGDWRFKWSLGYGCFAWRSGEVPPGKPKANGQAWPTVHMPVLGPVGITVSGGEVGGKILVEDELSGFSFDPELSPETMGGVMQLAVPGALGYRVIKLTALTPGVIFYGIQPKEAQPYFPKPFTFNDLPPL